MADITVNSFWRDPDFFKENTSGTYSFAGGGGSTPPGISWTGNTTNGVGTYVDDNTIRSNQYLTFNAGSVPYELRIGHGAGGMLGLGNTSAYPHQIWSEEDSSGTFLKFKYYLTDIATVDHSSSWNFHQDIVVDQDAQIVGLAGTGVRMVTADASGNLEADRITVSTSAINSVTAQQFLTLGTNIDGYGFGDLYRESEATLQHIEKVWSNSAAAEAHEFVYRHGGTIDSETNAPTDAIFKTCSYYAKDSAFGYGLGAEFVTGIDGAVADDNFDTYMTWAIKNGSATMTVVMSLYPDLYTVTTPVRFSDLSGTGERIVTVDADGDLQEISDISTVIDHTDIGSIGTNTHAQIDSHIADTTGNPHNVDEMVYPGAGIALSTGTAWGTSITDNSSNWNDAYTHSQIAGGDSVHVSTTENTQWDTAYTHSQIATGNPHSLEINDLSDVATAGVTDGQVLAYVDSSSSWEPTDAGSGSGTVTSVGLSLPAEFTVSGSPVTTSGTLTGVWANAAQNAVFAGPSTGGAGTPTFRTLVDADMPTSYDEANWDTAYTHSQITTGNPHLIGHADISDFSTGVSTHETSHSDVVVDGDFSTNGILRRTGAGAYGSLTGSASVDTVETTLSDDDTHIPTSGAVTDAIAGVSSVWQKSGTNLSPATGGDDVLLATGGVERILWGDGDTGLYESSDDVLDVIVEASSNWQWTTGGNITFRHIYPADDKGNDLGTTSYFWRYLYVDRIYLDTSSISIDVSGTDMIFTDGSNTDVTLSDLLGGFTYGNDNEIPYTNNTTDGYDYSSNLKFDGTAFSAGSDIVLVSSIGGHGFTMRNTSGVITTLHSVATASSGQTISWAGGESSSTTGTHHGGSATFKGGDQSGTGGGDGGNVMIYGGSSVSGTRGQIYFGDGTSVASLQNDETETNIVAYDTTTGLLTYRSVSSVGGGEWTADTNGITYTSGNVGIGTASHSTYDLSVQGTSWFNGYVTASGNIYSKGNSAYHYFGASDTGRIVHNGTDFYMQSNNHGGRILFQAEDSGGTNRALIYMDPDGETSAHYAGSKKFVTTDGGVAINTYWNIFDLPTFQMGAGGVTDEYLVLFPLVDQTSTTDDATGLNGQIMFQRGSGGSGNSQCTIRIIAQSAYTADICFAFEVYGPPAFTQIDEIDIDGIDYWALKAKTSDGGHALDFKFVGDIYNIPNDSNFLTRVRLSDANVTLVTSGVHYPHYQNNQGVIKFEDLLFIGDSSAKETTVHNNALVISSTGTNESSVLELVGNTTTSDYVGAVTFHNDSASTAADKRVGEVGCERDGDNDAGVVHISAANASGTMRTVAKFYNDEIQWSAAGNTEMVMTSSLLRPASAGGLGLGDSTYYWGTSYINRLYLPGISYTDRTDSLQYSASTDEVSYHTDGSDIRFKTVHGTINNASAGLKKIEPFIFTINELGYEKIGWNMEDMRYGVSAQDTQPIFPHIVKNIQVPGAEEYLKIDYELFSPILIAAHNEHTDEIDTLKNEIHQLRKQVEELLNKFK